MSIAPLVHKILVGAKECTNIKVSQWQGSGHFDGPVVSAEDGAGVGTSKGQCGGGHFEGGRDGDSHFEGPFSGWC